MVSIVITFCSAPASSSSWLCRPISAERVGASSDHVGMKDCFYASMDGDALTISPLSECVSATSCWSQFSSTGTSSSAAKRYRYYLPLLLAIFICSFLTFVVYCTMKQTGHILWVTEFSRFSKRNFITDKHQASFHCQVRST